MGVSIPLLCVGVCFNQPQSGLFKADTNTHDTAMYSQCVSLIMY